MTKVEVTITEALQELKTIDARIEKQTQFITTYMSRPNAQRDPHEKEAI